MKQITKTQLNNKEQTDRGRAQDYQHKNCKIPKT